MNDRPVCSSTDAPAAWRTSGHDTQVFVDDSGRRAVGVRLAGFALAALCAFWLVGLAVGMAGFSSFSAAGLGGLARVGSGPQLARVEAVSDRSASSGDATTITYRTARLNAVEARADSSVHATCPAPGLALRASSPAGRSALVRRARELADRTSAGRGAPRAACRPQLAAARGTGARSRLA